jgi:phytoene/squalene synthetase
VAFESGKVVTKAYSNSFSLAVSLLPAGIREGVYSIYGFVRLADEIVDTFHEYDKEALLDKFEWDAYAAINEKISLNPILHGFQLTVTKYNIDLSLVDAFLKSMRKDLTKNEYDRNDFNEYIYGSADVVGLMCLKVFVSGDEKEYQRLKSSAMKLGSAFQKVNFLRDMKDDYEILNRKYFPDVDMNNFSESGKESIIKEIENDFAEAYEGVKQLPPGVRVSVETAYRYYRKLLMKLKRTRASQIMQKRISISSPAKLMIMVGLYFKNKLRIA